MYVDDIDALQASSVFLRRKKSTSKKQRAKYRLYGESMEIRDLETRGPWAVASERSEDATKGPRVSKSRISIGRAV